MLIEACLLSCGLYAGASLYKKVRTGIEKLKASGQNILSEGQSVRNQTAIDKVSSSDAEKYERMIRRNFKLALLSLGFSLAGTLICTPLGYVSIAIILYLLIFVVRKALEGIFRKHLPIEIIDFGYIAILLFTGSLISSALASVFYYTYRMLRLATENRAKHTYLDMLGGQDQTAVWVLKDGTEVEIPAESVEVGDVVAVRAGETIPVDGTVIHGAASVAEHILTGEFQPAEKKAGDPVSAATLIISGIIHIRVEKSGADTEAARIISILEKTKEVTAYMEAIGQELADISVIPISLLALCALPVGGLQGAAAVFMSNFLAGMRLFAPISMLNFIRLGASQGIIFKDGRSLLLLSQVDTVVFDKTGTLTQEKPRVAKIYTFNGTTEDTLLSLAGAAEHRQTHPAALAILEEVGKRGIAVPEIDESHYSIGYGITVKTDDLEIKVGSDRFVEMEAVVLPDDFDDIRESVYEQGCSLVCVARDNDLIGAVELEPMLRPETEGVIAALKQLGMSVYIISGDHEKPTRAVAEAVGADRYFAGILPEAKAGLIEELRKSGRKVCFAGDGINDAIALKKADVSVSLRGASTAATDSAQVILADGSLNAVPGIFKLASDFQNNMQNTFATVTYPGILTIGGVFLAHFGIFQAFIMDIISSTGGMIVSMQPSLKQITGKKEDAASPVSESEN